MLAATVSIQGSLLDTVPGEGPEFPPEATTVMSLATAWKDPIEVAS